MAIKLKDFKNRLENRVGDALRKALGREVLEEAKDLLVEDIKTRVRLGYGVEKTGEGKRAFKPLASSYIKQRRKYGGLGQYASPAKSNLHKTGQMIEQDLDGKIKIGEHVNTITIELNTARSKEVAEFVSKERPFMNLSGPEIKRLTKYFKEQILETFRKALKSLD